MRYEAKNHRGLEYERTKAWKLARGISLPSLSPPPSWFLLLLLLLPPPLPPSLLLPPGWKRPRVAYKRREKLRVVETLESK